MNKKLIVTLFSFILISMLAVTTWASLNESMFAAFARVADDRWFLATLFDAYFGFLTFFLWVCYKEKSVGKSVLWFVLIMALGNIAMAAYVLLEVRRLKGDFSFQKLISQEKFA